MCPDSSISTKPVNERLQAELEALLHDLTSGDDRRAESSAQKIMHMEAHVMAPLLSMLNSSDPDHRWWATRALATLKQPAASEGLCQSLKDPNPSVRQCAALGLRERPSVAAIPSLIVSLGDPDRLVARLSGDALIAVGPLVIVPLSDAAQSTNPSVRIEATRSLAMISSPQTIPALFAALNDPSPLVEYWAEEGLNRLGIGMLFFKL
jgi:HEAT repeat protein